MSTFNGDVAYWISTLAIERMNYVFAAAYFFLIYKWWKMQCGFNKYLKINLDTKAMRLQYTTDNLIRFSDLLPNESFLFEEVVYKKKDKNTAIQLYSMKEVEFPKLEIVIPTERTEKQWIKELIEKRRKYEDFT